MDDGAVATLARAARDFVRDWRTLAGIEVFVVLVSLVVITPMSQALLRVLVSRSGNAALTDVDIALFFFTTKSGLPALLLLVAASLGITIFGQACLMTVGIARARGGCVRVRDAVAQAATRAIAILRLTLALFVRVLVLLVPFVAVIGATYWLLLREHDINYYLHARPPVFVVVCTIVAVLVLLLTIVLVRKLSSWLLILPLVVFERMRAWPAFAESARRMSGHRLQAVAVLALWGALTLVVSLATSAAIKLLGRAVAPAFGGTMVGLLVLVGAIVTVWALCSLAVNIFSTSLFALILASLFLATGPAAQLSLPTRFHNELEVEGKRLRVSWATLIRALALAVMLASGLTYVLMKDTWTDRSVLVFASRRIGVETGEHAGLVPARGRGACGLRRVRRARILRRRCARGARPRPNEGGAFAATNLVLTRSATPRGRYRQLLLRRVQG